MQPTAPFKTITVPAEVQEWLTPNVQQKMNERDSLFSKARRTNNTADWLRAHLKRNAVENEIWRTKHGVIKDLMNKNNKKPEDFWKGVRKLMPKNKSGGNIKLKDDITGLEVDSSKVADYINVYFSTIGEKLAVKHPAVAIPPMRDDIDSDTDLLHTPFLVEDILEILKLVDRSKSSNIKHIKTWVLCDIFKFIPEKLCLIYNASLTQKIFPQSWKVATVSPIPKKGNSKKVTNLRPISLLPLPGKILEKLMAKRLRGFMKENGILCKNQHGFRPKHSTTTATPPTLDIFMIT